MIGNSISRMLCHWISRAFSINNSIANITNISTLSHTTTASKPISDVVIPAIPITDKFSKPI